MGFLSRKNAVLLIGAVALLGAACLSGAPSASAQITVPTPLPQVVATKQAADNAAAQVNDLQAQRAQTEARLAEINRNIEYQIAEAERAAAAAREAAAAQNAVEAGVAIGRLEGALAQLRDSYAGKDSIIGDTTARLEQLAAQSAADRRTIDGLTMQLQQAQRDKQAALNAYNAVAAQQQTSQTNDTVNSAVKLIVSLAFLFAVLILGAFALQHRRAAPPLPPPVGDVIEPEFVSADDTQESVV